MSDFLDGIDDPRRDFLKELVSKAVDRTADKLLGRLSIFGLDQDIKHAVMNTGASTCALVAARPPAPAANAKGFTYDRAYFRPPGAMPEAEFLDTCSRCNTCVEVCPEYCIVPAQPHMGAARGTPVMFPNEEACTLCGKCMDACPTGALTPVPPEFVRIGLARINETTCLAWGESHCSACHDACPTVPNAIEFPEGYPATSPRVNADACTGCGLCVPRCPTKERSILVHLRPVQMDAAPDGDQPI